MPAPPDPPPPSDEDTSASGLEGWLTRKERSSAVWGAAVAVIRRTRRLQRLALNPAARSEAIVTVTRRGELHQESSATAWNRYPALFLYLRDHFSDRPTPPRLLSFGCATGEEVFSLRGYFPQSEIVGVDINRRCLRICRRRNSDARITFRPYDRSQLAGIGPFDAIFCLAVFQKTSLRGTRVTDSSLIYPFDRFDGELRFLDRLLAPGGSMVVYMTNYPFEESSIASRYEALPLRLPGALPKFDRRNRCRGRVAFEHPVYLKKHADGQGDAVAPG